MSTHWSTQEKRFLYVNYDRMTNHELAEFLGRSERAVRSQYARIKSTLEVPDVSTFVMSRAGRPDANVSKDIKGTIRSTNRTVYKKGSAYANTKSGYRPDLEINVRSGWEANIMRVLKAYDIEFEFEPRTFAYPVKRGNKAYIPDIYLNGTDEWIEIKGYLDKNSQVKIKRFKTHYPKEFARLIMIIGKYNKKARKFCEELEVPLVLYYQNFSKHFKDTIPTWEGK